MSSALALRVVVISLGALLALAALARIRRVEAAHEDRWSARADARRPGLGDGYRASRATMWIARGVPRLVRVGATLGTLSSVLVVLSLSLAPVVIAEQLAPALDRTLFALAAVMPLVVAGALAARELTRDAERLARCDPEELEPRAGLEGRWMGFATMLVLALLGLVGDALLVVTASGAVLLAALEHRVTRESSRRVRETDRTWRAPSRALRA